MVPAAGAGRKPQGVTVCHVSSLPRMAQERPPPRQESGQAEGGPLKRGGLRELVGLQEEQGDVDEECGLANVNLFIGDGAEELGENLIDLGGRFGFGRRAGELGGQTGGFRGLAVQFSVVSAEGGMR